MTPLLAVSITARFERDYRRLLKTHPDLAKDYDAVVSVLGTDPHNRSRTHAIKKREQVSPGEGQYRFRSGRFRFRYDIEGASVYLKYCGLRREDTYR
jgi:mRNA-degrading endonuclease RelE of RelBE toxin-antitoxin system